MKKILIIIFLLLAVFFAFNVLKNSSLINSGTTMFDINNQNNNEPFVCRQTKGEIKTSLKAPENKAKSVLLMDFDTEKVIYEKNVSKKLPSASLTKLMTSVISLQENKPDTLLQVSNEATKSGEAAMGLKENEYCSVKELIYGMILNSGNEAAETTAQKNREDFLIKMNKKAKNLCMDNTYFVNPTGLDEESNQVNTTSAFDLAYLIFFIKDNYPIIMNALTTWEYHADGKGHQSLFLYNTAWKFTNNYPYLIGGKTGNTDKTGYNFIGLSEKKEKKLLLIILKEPTFNDIRQDSQSLFDYGFEILENI